MQAIYDATSPAALALRKILDEQFAEHGVSPEQNAEQLDRACRARQDRAAEAEDRRRYVKAGV